MNINILELVTPLITLACLIVGFVIHNTKVLKERLDDFIPLIVTVLGIVLGLALDGPSIKNAIIGALSGLSSTGLYEAFKNLIEKGRRLDA